jgi:NitT/TauT family transport system ATP-binding protein
MIYQSKQGDIEAVRDITFDLGSHEFVSIIGPSGCGKSTLLRIAADILPPTEGKVVINKYSPSEARMNREFAFVFQDPVVVPWRTVIRNVELPLEVMGADPSVRTSKAKETLELVGLKGFESMLPRQLSGGMKQRAAIARALTYDPPILYMDEPFGALDEITRDRMNLELLRIWNETKAAILFVTHSIDEAVFLSDRVVVLTPRPGRVKQIIDVPLPRPRTVEMKRSKECFNYIFHAREILHEPTE